MAKYKYVILGGGMVAGYLTKELADDIPSGEMAIVSSDDALPYERPPLSKGFLAGKEKAAEIAIAPEEFYRQHGVDVRLRTIVTRVDIEKKALHLKGSDEPLHYDKLVVATGARVRTLDVPGSKLPGVMYLRSMDDSKRIRGRAKDARNAVIVGAGFIGMEVASVLAQQGVHTTVVFPEERVWERIFTPRMSAFFQRYYEQRGVSFRNGETLKSFEGRDGVTAAITSSGEPISAELAVVGIGVEPAVDMLGESGLRVDNGVVVNEYLEASDPDVYAAGDVANYRDVIFNKRRRIEHWDNAVEQGKHVGRALAGQRAPFEHVPYFFSDVFDLSYELWGDVADANDVIHRGDTNTDSFSTWWLRDGILVAAFVMNRPDEEREMAQRWIAERRQPPLGVLRDPAQPLAA